MVNSNNSSANHDNDQQSKKPDQHPDSPGQAEVDEEDWAETSMAGEEDPGATAEEVGVGIAHHKWGDSPPDANKDLD